ncbi:MAG: hypothetical protein QME32_02970 [Endomicrobiia bacterium]|nr:hypothetical protein [Endomicrobiia bacterium]
MKFNVYVLYPFDLGLELDFKGRAADEFFKSMSSKKISLPVSAGDSPARISPVIESTTNVYKFGVGVTQIKLLVECEMKELAELSFSVENVRIGKTRLDEYARSVAEGVTRRAQKLAAHSYELRLPDAEIFPIFTADDPLADDAARFIERNKKVIFGILSGERDYERLSEYVLEQEKLVNYGYYENEIILIKRFGAFVASSDAAAVADMIKLALAQYWSLKSYNYIMDKELDTAQTLLGAMPPYYKFWKMPSAYHRFSVEAIDFDKDKISIVDSLYNVMINIPRVEADWHLGTIHKNVNKVFDIDGLYKTVGTKIERIEESYNSARDYMSTNFFILLDIIFFLSLAWSVFDTVLLFTIARK